MKYTQATHEQEACRDLVFAFLHNCWAQTGGADPHADPSTFTLRPNPFYERNDVLTEEVVEKVIFELENLMLDEFKKFPGYHERAQGVHEAPGAQGTKLRPTQFDRLPYDMKLAIVQGIDEIMQPFRIPDVVAAADVDGQPLPHCEACGAELTYCVCGADS